MTGTAVHFGTLQVTDLRTALAALAPTATVFVDGDGWSVWGEQPGEAGNDPLSLHVTVVASLEAEAEQLFRVVPEQHGDLLVSMSTANDWGVIAVVTEQDDWSALSMSAERPTCPRCGLFVPDGPRSLVDLDAAICRSCGHTEQVERRVVGTVAPRPLWADRAAGR